jgi:hypothetical protein
MLNQGSATGVQYLMFKLCSKEWTFGKVAIEHADSDKIFHILICFDSRYDCDPRRKVLRVETVLDRSSWLPFSSRSVEDAAEMYMERYTLVIESSLSIALGMSHSSPPKNHAVDRLA